MKRICSRPAALWLVACLMAACLRLESAPADESISIQAQLIWGTNDAQSPDPKHKMIDAELAGKFKNTPYRWKNYFEVKRECATIPTGQSKTLQMSERCKIEIKNLGGDHVEIKPYGEGKQLSTNKEKISEDWPLIFAGDAKNDTAWMVVLKKVSPAQAKAETAKPK